MIDRKKRNEEILNACANVFFEKGIEKATMRNFSEAIGYSPATIYQSYKDKKEIVRHCLYFCVDQRNQLISEILTANVETPENLLTAMDERKDEIKRWSAIIVRILTSPNYQELQGEVNSFGETITVNFKGKYADDVYELFMIYYSVMVHYSITEDEGMLEMETSFLKKQMSALKK